MIEFNYMFLVGFLAGIEKRYAIENRYGANISRNKWGEII